MKTKRRYELMGDIFIFGSVLLWSAFPILLVSSNGLFSPFFYGGMSNIIAGIFILGTLFLFQRKALKIPREAVWNMCIGIFLMMLVFYPLMFFAGQKTAAGNIAILGQTEVLFSFLFFGLLGLEKVSVKRVLGMVFVIIGATTLLAREFSGSIESWDFLIVIASAIAPFGDYFQKKTVQILSPLAYAGYRGFIGGCILLFLSFLFENPIAENLKTVTGLFLLLANGIFVFGFSKWFWNEGLKRIGVTKSNAIGSAGPAITILLAFLFLHDIPTTQQWIGLFAVCIGTPLILSRVKNVEFSGTVLSGDKIGTRLGFPTINIFPDTKMPEGVFAVHAEVHEKMYSGVLHAGPRPTLGKMEFRAELHLFGFSEEVPEKTEIKGEILKKLRSVKKFENTEALKKQIADDIKKAKRYL